jgi:hypothetical protein
MTLNDAFHAPDLMDAILKEIDNSNIEIIFAINSSIKKYLSTPT